MQRKNCALVLGFVMIFAGCSKDAPEEIAKMREKNVKRLMTIPKIASWKDSNQIFIVARVIPNTYPFHSKVVVVDGKSSLAQSAYTMGAVKEGDRVRLMVVIMDDFNDIVRSVILAEPADRP